MPSLSPEINCFAISPAGSIAPRPSMSAHVDAVMSSEGDWILLQAKHHHQESFAPLWRELAWAATRQAHLSAWRAPDEEELRAYTVPLIECFYAAAKSYPAVKVDPGVMAGAPCIEGTRIPIYMILDAIEHCGNLEGAVESYPRLSLEQIKHAIGFAKLVVECPIEHENTTAS